MKSCNWGIVVPKLKNARSRLEEQCNLDKGTISPGVANYLDWWAILAGFDEYCYLNRGTVLPGLKNNITWIEEQYYLDWWTVLPGPRNPELRNSRPTSTYITWINELHYPDWGTVPELRNNLDLLVELVKDCHWEWQVKCDSW